MSRAAFIAGEYTSVQAPLALGALNNRWSLAKAADFNSDVEVLNYALTLEYLEAEFYRQGNNKGLTSGKTRRYLTTIEEDEAFHVTAITATIKSLGGTPVKAPGVDFGDAFASRTSFLTTAVTFENVGVGAYLGAAGFIKSKAVLQAAAGIFGVEARHAAIIGNLLGLTPEGGVYKGAFETPIAKATVLSAVAPFLTGKAPTGGVGTGVGDSGAMQTGLVTAGGVALVGAAAAGYLARKKATEAKTDS